MSATINVLPLLRDYGLDDHEAVVAVQSAANEGGSRRTGKGVFELGFGDNRVAEVRFNSALALSSIVMSSKRWSAVRPIIESDAQSHATRVARTALLSYREVKGFARVPNWLQIRPVICELKDSTSFGALTTRAAASVPLPFAVEVMFRHSELPLLEGHRRIWAIQEARWLLAAFVDIPVFGLNSPYCWALLEGAYHLVQCGTGLGLEEVSDQVFSDIGGLPALEIVERRRYFSELGIPTSDFRIPDLAPLWKKYTELGRDKKRRFLRACASLSSAAQPGITDSQKVVALVTAIEPLLSPAERCESCGAQTGITRQFRKFLDEHVAPPPEIRDLYEGVYAARSKIVHGDRRFEVDEPFLGIQVQGDFLPLAAWGAAKGGVVNWLCAQ
jgi:hypothetical protein